MRASEVCEGPLIFIRCPEGDQLSILHRDPGKLPKYGNNAVTKLVWVETVT